ncbi:MAG: tetratricopeptide repeat protein [Armatimonadota bacterium]
MGRFTWRIAVVLVVLLAGIASWGQAAGGTTGTTGTTGPAEPRPQPAPPNYLAEGNALMEKKEYSKALSKFMMAWLDMPDNPAVIVRIGQVFAGTGKLAESTRFFAFAIKLKPGYEEPVVELGRVYLKLNRADQAIILLEDPVRAKTFADSFRCRHLLGMAYLNQGKYAKAITAFKAAITLAPDQGFLFGDMGNALYLNEQYEEAVRSYNLAVERSPKDTTARLNRSMALEKLGKFTDAVAALEEYLTLVKAAQDHPQRKRLEELKQKAAAPPAPAAAK